MSMSAVKERKPILTKVMKEDFTEEIELEMGNVGLVRFEQARRAKRSEHK